MVDEAEPAVAPAVEDTASEVASMEVRGATAIADAAAAALADQARASEAETPAALRAEFAAAARTLLDTRPTAVSLANALRTVLQTLEERPDDEPVDALADAVVDRAEQFRAELELARDRLGRIGARRFDDGDVVMTHCHSTDALACLEAAVDAGTAIEAVVKETRPRNQGYITARRLSELDVPVTLVVDNAAHRLLAETDTVLVGADSVAADGSVVNKIGTSGLAASARDRGVPVVVAAQTVKLHPDTLTGHPVDIEERDPDEVVDDETRAELGDVAVANPAFDVTPPRYVDAIVTERGQFPPESVVTLMRELFGTAIAAPWEA